MSLSSLLLIFILIFSISCSTPNRELGWERKEFKEKLNRINGPEAIEIRRDALVMWSKRHERSSLEGALKQFEKLANSKARNLQILTFLSRGYYLLADAHENDKIKKIIYWEKGLRFGEQALALDDSFRDRVESNIPIERSAMMLSSEYNGALYWTAANLGRWSIANGVTTFLKFRSQIRTFVQIVQDTTPEYFYNAPSRFLGALYAYTPSFAGGDLNQSKTEFGKALDASPQYLRTKVLISELYYSKTGNKKMFIKNLNEVISADTTLSIEIEPENILAKKKAEYLLTQTDILFEK